MTKLETAGIITKGAIVLYRADEQPALSYISGCYWIGIDAVPDDYVVDHMMGTEISTEFDKNEEADAQRRNLLWCAARDGKSAQYRLLMALDSLGGQYQGTRVALADVVGFGRERLINVLTEVVNLGYAEKAFERANLRPEYLGQFWDYPTKKSSLSRPSEVSK
jgi:hypothetical protein